MMPSGCSRTVQQYIRQVLPDKAIDLIDEAASKIRVESFIAPDDLKSLEEKLEELQKEKEEAVNNQNFEKAAEIRDMERQIKEELKNKQVNWEQKKHSSNMTVSYDEIAAIVSNWTGVPVSKMTTEESERLLKLEDTLHKKVIGQEQAVKAVSSSVRRARVGLKDPKKPVGSFIFVVLQGWVRPTWLIPIGGALWGRGRHD